MTGSSAARHRPYQGRSIVAPHPKPPPLLSQRPRQLAQHAHAGINSCLEIGAVAPGIVERPPEALLTWTVNPLVAGSSPTREASRNKSLRSRLPDGAPLCRHPATVRHQKRIRRPETNRERPWTLTRRSMVPIDTTLLRKQADRDQRLRPGSRAASRTPGLRGPSQLTRLSGTRMPPALQSPPPYRHQICSTD